MTETSAGGRRRVWPWIVGGVVLLILLAVGAFTLGQLTAPAGAPRGIATLASTPSTTDSAAPSTAPTPTTAPRPSATPVPAGPKLTSDEIEFYEGSVTSRNTSVLAQSGSLSNPVRVSIAGQNCCGEISPDAAVAKLDYVVSSNPKWSFSNTPAALAAYRANPKWRSYFPVNAVIGHSSNGETIAFSFTSAEKVKAIFMAKGSF